MNEPQRKGIKLQSVKDYEKEFDFLLDNLQIATITNLYSIYQSKEVINGK